MDPLQGEANPKAAFAKRLVRLRGDRSLRDVARAAGISAGTLLQLEAGVSNPRLSTVRRLALALGVPESELLGEAGTVGTFPDQIVPEDVDSSILATWTEIASHVVDELEERRLDGALGFVGRSVFVELLRLAIKHVSPTTPVLLEARAPGVVDFCLLGPGERTFVTPSFLPATPASDDVERMRLELAGVRWETPPGERSMVVIASCAPPGMARVALQYVQGLDDPKPGTRLVFQPNLRPSPATPEVYCVTHAARGDVKVTVAAVGLDVTQPRGSIRSLRDADEEAR